MQHRNCNCDMCVSLRASLSYIRELTDFDKPLTDKQREEIADFILDLNRELLHNASSEFKE